MTKSSRTRTKSIQFSHPIISGPGHKPKKSPVLKSILKSPSRKEEGKTIILPSSSRPKRSGRRRIKETELTISKDPNNRPTVLNVTPDLSKKKPSPKVKIIYSPLEQIVIQAVKQWTKNKRMAHAPIVDKWNQSNIPSIDLITDHDIKKGYSTYALNPDQKFYVDLSGLRKLYPQVSEEKIRCYAYQIDQFIRESF